MDKLTNQAFRFHVFAVLLAIAILFEVEYLRPSLPYWYMWVSATVLLCLPRNPWAFLNLVLSQVFLMLYSFPYTGNHPLYLSIVGGFIVTAAVWQMIVRRKAFSDAEFYHFMNEKVFPILRLSLVILYSFAAFHKLNYGYFDVDNTCVLYVIKKVQRYLWDFPLPSGWFLQVSIWGSLFVEGVCPWLLLSSRIRPFAIATLLAFHLFLSPYYLDFSSLALVMISLFIPLEILHRVKAWWQKIPYYNWVLRIFFFLLAMGWAHSKWTPVPFLFSARLSALVGLVLLVIFCWEALSKSGRQLFLQQNLYLRPNRVGMLFLFLIIFNGMGPYLGFRTSLAFSMYDNMVTEVNTNHIIIRSKFMQIFDDGEDLVQVIDTNMNQLPEIQTIVNHRRLSASFNSWRKKYLVPRFEVERELEQYSNYPFLYFRVLNVKTGEESTMTYEQIRHRSGLLSFIKRKVFAYRAIPPERMHSCRW